MGKSCKSCVYVSYHLELGHVSPDKDRFSPHEEKWRCSIMRDSNSNRYDLKDFIPCPLYEHKPRIEGWE